MRFINNKHSARTLKHSDRSNVNQNNNSDFILGSSREHVKVKELFKPFADKKIVWCSIGHSLHYFLQYNPIIDVKLEDDEYLFLSSSQEIDYMSRTEKALIETLWASDIDPKQVCVVNSNHLGKTSYLKYVYWEYFETAVRQLEHNEIDVNKKTHNKKFLCLNRILRQHRKDFMYAMNDLNLLEHFNASLWDDKLSLRYDTADNDTNWWYSINEKFSYENTLWVITESVFNNDDNLTFLSEKTFKTILLKMPFIIIGQPYTLKKLKSLGYKTFNHMWDESYDEIRDTNKRMNAIIKLVSHLSTIDLKQLVVDNYDILEYNYKNLMMRRPEQTLLDTMEKI
tara:strand:- start:3875 stop:4894 length:1020 start_codon:yes stop_codon:yes gene_type:complete